MTKFTIKVRESIASVATLEQVGRKTRKVERFAFSALGTNIYETRRDNWLIVHHHASKPSI